jgi:hypothetical protein
VKRRYSEFEWLHERLSNLHPDVVLPPLPPKRTFGRFRDDFIDERKQGLQTFLQFLASHPKLRYDRVFQLFCERPVEVGFHCQSVLGACAVLNVLL